MQACNSCKSYKKGNGSPACTRCPEIKQLNILDRARPCVEYIKIPREILEALSENTESLNIYEALTIQEATLIFYLYTLNLTHQEVARELKIDRSTVTKQKKLILAKLKTYIIEG